MSIHERRAILAEARRVLDIEHLVLAIHDASFPSRAEEDTGRGSPYSQGACDLAAWAQDQGFTGLQLGPQGETSATNPSPYDGTAFARTVLSVALWPLAHDARWERVLTPYEVEAIVASAPSNGGGRVAYDYVFREYRAALRTAHGRLGRGGDSWRRFEEFRRAHAWWLERDSRYEALTTLYRTDDWRAWPRATPPARDEVFEFGQFVVHSQHAELLAHADATGLRLFGDLQIGISHRDRFERDGMYLKGYLMGAPPSRTNTEGQPWGYPVFAPDSAEPLRLLQARVTKMLSELHGLRIDHPHGLVCPWVYRSDTDDPMLAVRSGARLFESPDLLDHPELAHYAIARPDQIDRAAARYADNWVGSLDDRQVDAYARQMEAVVSAARAEGRSTSDLLIEVLSTCPYPLKRVMDRYGFGRFLVTQKADPRDPKDPYSTSRAERRDWVMLGNHDTPPIWRRVTRWHDEGKVGAWCDYLESRLGAKSIDRAMIAANPSALAQAMLTDLLSCNARYVSVFFADLFGLTEIYNQPGVVNASNWSLRLGNDFATAHAVRVRDHAALDVPRALATALRARGHVVLANDLERSRA